MAGIDPILLEVFWNRLISIVNEQATALMNASFTTVVREAGDLSAGIFETEGNMLAQAVTGTPGHINTMALAVRHFLAYCVAYTTYPLKSAISPHVPNNEGSFQPVKTSGSMSAPMPPTGQRQRSYGSHRGFAGTTPLTNHCQRRAARCSDVTVLGADATRVSSHHLFAAMGKAR